MILRPSVHGRRRYAPQEPFAAVRLQLRQCLPLGCEQKKLGLHGGVLV